MVKATLVASLGAAVFAYAVCILVALAVWAFAAHGDSRVDDALRAGSFAFLALHGSPFEIGDARFSLPLLGLTLIPIVLLSRALGRAWRRKPIAGHVEMLTVASLGVAPYLLFALGVSLFWSSSDAGVPLISSLAWVLLIACAAAGVAWWQVVRTSPLANVPAPQPALGTRRVLAGAMIVLLIMFSFASLIDFVRFRGLRGFVVARVGVWLVAGHVDLGRRVHVGAWLCTRPRDCGNPVRGLIR